MIETIKTKGFFALGIFFIILGIIEFFMPVSLTKWLGLAQKTPFEMWISYALPFIALFFGILGITAGTVYFYYNRKHSEDMDVVADEADDNEDDDDEGDDVENDEYIQKLFKKHDLD